jgi:hypothetical protein
METVMNRTNVAAKICLVVFGSALPLGCATTETARFRQMSAADHDRVASALPADAQTASEHLNAARQLRDAERLACTDVPTADRDAGPFANRARIESVDVLRDRTWAKGMMQPVGVAIDLRAEPGVTEQWLSRVLECHLAHQAVVGRSAYDWSPLSQYGAKITVTSTATGFRVTITSPDIDVARSVIAKGESLVGAPSSTATDIASNRL